MSNNKEYHKQWSLRNKDKIAAHAKARKEKQRNDPNHKLHRRSQLLNLKYGITHADYLIQLAHQNNQCAICKAEHKKDKYFHVDHCHDTGRVRGLLCHQCNWYMGLVDRDQEIKVRLSMYGCSVKQVHPDIRAKQWNRPKKNS